MNIKFDTKYGDTLYGWESTLLEPLNFWSFVPDKIKPIYHFMNVPVDKHGSISKSSMSPLRFIEEVATPEDFVVFKLDIDHSATEMPLASQIANSAKFAEIIDEFFFEYHFDCEIMMSKGGAENRKWSAGNTEQRTVVLEYFAKLRRKGIRAHIWV